MFVLGLIGYKEISFQIRGIFADYTDLIEPLSLDEAFLDVTVNKKNIDLAADIATEIRTRIKDEIGLSLIHISEPTRPY